MPSRASACMCCQVGPCIRSKRHRAAGCVLCLHMHGCGQFSWGPLSCFLQFYQPHVALRCCPHLMHVQATQTPWREPASPTHRMEC
jgi:hypothetical protein